MPLAPPSSSESVVSGVAGGFLGGSYPDPTFATPIQGAAGVTPLAIEAADAVGTGTDLLELYDNLGHLFFAIDDTGNFIFQPTAAQIAAGGHANFAGSTTFQGNPAPDFSAGLAISWVTSGALDTTIGVPVSGTAFQMPAASRDTDGVCVIPVTYTPTAGAAATCKVELSPDNVTYSTLYTRSIPAGVVFDGTVDPVVLWVHANWWVKLTVVNAAFGTATFF